jgi:uncharacterized membrane protein HdeD (DUF308 family)
MSIITISIAIAVMVAIRALISYYISRRYPGFIKWVGYYVLTLVSGIFIFFPTCILLGNKVCWDVDVYTQKTGLLVFSVIILLLCAWVWYKIIEDPKMETSSGKPVAALIIVLTVIIGLVILILGTSPYWAPFVGH